MGIVTWASLRCEVLPKIQKFYLVPLERLDAAARRELPAQMQLDDPPLVLGQLADTLKDRCDHSFLNSRIFRRKGLSSFQLRVYNLFVPLFKLERFFPLPFGISLLAVGKKSE